MKMQMNIKRKKSAARPLAPRRRERPYVHRFIYIFIGKRKPGGGQLIPQTKPTLKRHTNSTAQ